MHTRCTARTRSGEQCKNRPMIGATTCRMHGAATQRSRQAAARRIAKADAEAALAYTGQKDFDDPLLELGRLATEALALKDALAARVNALREPTYETYEGRERLRVEVELYERALDRSAKFLDILSRSGFDERRLQVEEAQAQTLVKFAFAIGRHFGVADHDAYKAAVQAAIQELIQEAEAKEQLQ